MEKRLKHGRKAAIISTFIAESGVEKANDACGSPK